VLPVNAEDVQILELARTEDRAVVSQDLDYSALLASKGYNRPSVVSLRLHNNRPERIAIILEKILPSIEADLQTGVIVVMEEGRIRIRPLPLSSFFLRSTLSD
jgi:predicted nuclease of predicted toxin-antitoxin system